MEALGLLAIHHQDEHAPIALDTVRELDVVDVDPEVARQGGDLGQHAGAVGDRHPQLGQALGRTARRGSERRAVAACSSSASSPALSAAATRSRMPNRSASNVSRAATMAGAFSAQTSGQIPGWPAAMRVMSRKPPAASRSSAPCSSAARSARFMSVAAVKWGTWDTIATSVSCCCGDRARISAPRLVTTAWRRAYASGSVLVVGVSTHVAPTKRSGSAPSMPTCSDPAMGWPPTKRGSDSCAASGAFTPDTSVTTAPGRRVRCKARVASATTAPKGVAMNVISADASSPTASTAPSALARSAAAGSAS